ncbi:MAG TPA: FAD-dependent monooxygenase [Acidobacteriaceae bacterium]|nr:FAD-dependent monooxygenase [Acidobacteriaceae bacterium]
MSIEKDSTEVLIVGGGPAGLAAAIALRQKGVECLVVEAAEPAMDKGCAEGLMPDALASLRNLGLKITEQHGHHFRGIRFNNAQHHVHADFPNGLGIGVRRTKLHGLIADRAREAGVALSWRSRARLLDSRSALVNGKKISFRYLVGADGQASGVRQWVGLGQVQRESIRYGFRRHYNIAPWSEYVEVHWGSPGQVYVTPIAADSVCVVFITNNPKVAQGDFLKAFPAVAERLQGIPAMSTLRGGISANRKLRRVANQSVALIGDASGSPDAITGEGLAVSFRQAVSLARAIERGNLELYNREHQKIGRLPHAMSWLMLSMDRWPQMQGRAIKTLSTHPDYFQQLLSVHVGAQTVQRFAMRRGIQLGWSFLEASLY